MALLGHPKLHLERGKVVPVLHLARAQGPIQPDPTPRVLSTLQGFPAAAASWEPLAGPETGTRARGCEVRASPGGTSALASASSARPHSTPRAPLWQHQQAQTDPHRPLPRSLALGPGASVGCRRMQALPQHRRARRGSEPGAGHRGAGRASRP
jgi:hypothetical protein